MWKTTFKDFERTMESDMYFKKFILPIYTRDK